MPKKQAPSKKRTAVGKSPASRKPPARKTVRTTSRRPAATTRSAPTRRETTASDAAPKKGRFSPKQLEVFRKQLLDLRDRLVDGINFLARENLNNSQREASGDLSNYGIHMADQGTDNFDREFALNVVSNEQDALYEIDEALHRIERGTYGICEMTGRPIEIERLRAVPYARFCLAAQTEMEKGRKHFRPFSAAGLPSVEP